MIYPFFILIIFILLYFIWRNQYNYWIKKNVKGPAPLPFIGNFGRIAIMQQSIGGLFNSVYTQYPDEKFVGIHYGLTPMLLIRDPDILKQIMVTDFNVFVNRGIKTKEQGFSHNLLIAEGDVWKTIRNIMTPSFTTAKLKQMIPGIKACLNKLMKHIDDIMNQTEIIDIKECATSYSLDSISSSMLGAQLDFYNDNSTHYLRDLVNEAVTPSLLYRVWHFIEMSMPGMHRIFTKLDFTPHMRQFFLKLIKTSINKREINKIEKNDLLDAFIQFKRKRKIESKNPSFELEVDDNIIASQVFSFYAAGVDTISSTIAFLLYELSLNSDIQKKVYKEICLVVNKHNEELNLDYVNELHYLNAVFDETMRKHYVIDWIIRKSIKNYTVPGSDLIIPAGTFIAVSLSGLHNDPKYIADPNKFDPDNFSDEKFKHMQQFPFMPFGIGPRNCIGIRFAKLNVMLAVTQILKRFEVKPCTTQGEIKSHPCSLTRNPIDGIRIKLCRRTTFN